MLRPGGHFIGMLYERRSAVAAKLWIKHGLLAMHPRRSLADVLSAHMESPGTKAYTTGELRALFAGFTSVTYQHFVTPYDKAGLPRLLADAIPSHFGWFVAIEALR